MKLYDILNSQSARRQLQVRGIMSPLAESPTDEEIEAATSAGPAGSLLLTQIVADPADGFAAANFTASIVPDFSRPFPQTVYGLAFSHSGTVASFQTLPHPIELLTPSHVCKVLGRIFANG